MVFLALEPEARLVKNSPGQWESALAVGAAVAAVRGSQKAAHSGLSPGRAR